MTPLEAVRCPPHGAERGHTYQSRKQIKSRKVDHSSLPLEVGTGVNHSGSQCLHRTKLIPQETLLDEVNKYSPRFSGLYHQTHHLSETTKGLHLPLITF